MLDEKEKLMHGALDDVAVQVVEVVRRIRKPVTPLAEHDIKTPLAGFKSSSRHRPIDAVSRDMHCNRPHSPRHRP